MLNFQRVSKVVIFHMFFLYTRVSPPQKMAKRSPLWLILFRDGLEVSRGLQDQKPGTKKCACLKRSGLAAETELDIFDSMDLIFRWPQRNKRNMRCVFFCKLPLAENGRNKQRGRRETGWIEDKRSKTQSFLCFPFPFHFFHYLSVLFLLFSHYSFK